MTDPKNPTNPKNKIEVQDGNTPDKQDKPGETVSLALVGPSRDLFEIRYSNVDGSGREVRLGEAYYYVNDTEVPREVYLDCLATADKDTFCPGCDGVGEDDEDGFAEPGPGPVGPS